LQGYSDELEKSKMLIKKQEDGFYTTFSSLYANKKSLIERIAKLKGEVEDEAITEFNKTQEKKLLGGIGIRQTKVFTYDENEALQWAKKSGLCLTLDKKSFEKIASVQKLTLVTETIIPKVTFPKKIQLED
jgi:hypothetical protein